MNVIEVKELTRKFGAFAAVDRISFAVASGEMFGFLGPNGAGKTTTINMLCTLLKPTSGQALVAGHDVVRRPDLVRRAIGLVFQDGSLDEGLTAAENLYFHAVLYGLPAPERRRRVAEALEVVGLAGREKQLVRTFSGGMKRRLEIARGLLHWPRILFLDEPTLGLDPQTRKYIWEYIHDLRRRYEVTVFLTTHYMEEAEGCGRVAVMDHGRLVALDAPAKLKHRVGGDIITLRTPERVRAKEYLERRGLAPREADGALEFEVPNGEEFLPRLLHEADFAVEGAGLRRPTLEDVFIKLTGRAIRDETLDAKDQMRAHMRRWRR